MLLANIGCLLDDKCSDKLEKCKQFCCALKVSDESSELLFDDKQLKEINQCHTFHQLFASHLNFHLNWEQYSILESIIALTELKEAEDELDKYMRHMASKMGMKIISDTFSIDDLPPHSIKLSIIVDKPYTKLTAGKYSELKDFICATLKIQKYVTYPYIKFFFESLHLEWYIPVQAARYMIKTAAGLDISLFHQQSVVMLKVGDEVLFDCTVKQVSKSINTASQSFGGYDYNFVENLPDRLVCNICCFPCSEVQQSNCCGHSFCKSCLELHFYYDLTKSTCPVCRTDKFVGFPHNQADREIKGLKIYCPSKESGCEWVGELNDIHKHIKDGKCCDVTCDKCDKTLPSTGVKSHLDTECPFYCPYCDITVEREVISSEHKEKCHKFPLTCPNNCGLDNIPQGNIDEHRKECPLEMIRCEYFDVGCTVMMHRRDQKQHNSETLNRNHHLHLLHKKQATQAITTNSWLQYALAFSVLIMLVVNHYFSATDHSSKDMNLFEHFQQHHPTLLWSMFLIDSNELSLRGHQVAPVVLKLSDFDENLKNQKRWDSSPFFAYEGGYQMRLGIHPINVSMYDRFFLSASLYVTHGPHDNTLEHLGDQRLFEGTFTIELLNQLGDNDHIANEVILTNSEVCKECSEMSFDKELVRMCGYPVLLPNDTFLQKNNTDYVRNNSLYFRVSYKKADSIYMQLFNYYYYYIMRYLITPSMAGVSVIAARFLASTFHLHSTEHALLIYIVHLAGLGIYMENSVLKGIYWVWCYFLYVILLLADDLESNLAKIISKLKEEKCQEFLLMLALAVVGCLATGTLDIILFYISYTPKL